MRILIIGGSGYIGPSLVQALRTQPTRHHLTGLDAGWFASQVDGRVPLPEVSLDEFRLGDVRDLVAADLEGFDSVIYLAAISNDPMGNRFRDLTFEINLRQATRVAGMALDAGASHFVFASSASVYGRGSGDRSEHDTLDPQTAYAETKIQAEGELAQLANSQYKISCLRFATACGWSPRIRLDLVLNDFVATALTKGRIEVLSDGSPWRPLIHVDDMARAVCWAISPDRDAVSAFVSVNVGSPEWNFQIKELAQAVATSLGGVDVLINQMASPDSRSYRLDFSRWMDIAPNHQPQVSLEQAIDQLAEGLGTLPDLRADFRSSERIRLKQLESMIAKGYLNEDLRWLM